jgi:hypothetical protein
MTRKGDRVQIFDTPDLPVQNNGGSVRLTVLARNRWWH